jgi:translation initiation factor IF-2
LSKNLKINIKNTQLAKALNLEGLKDKLEKKKMLPDSKEDKPFEEKRELPKGEKPIEGDDAEKEKTRVKARSKSVFAPKAGEGQKEEFSSPSIDEVNQEVVIEEPAKPLPVAAPVQKPLPPKEPPRLPARMPKAPDLTKRYAPLAQAKPLERLGPTGKHIKDLIPPPAPKKPPPPPVKETPRPSPAAALRANAPLGDKERRLPEAKEKEKEGEERKEKQTRFKEFRDIKPPKKGGEASSRSFDTRDKQGLREDDEEGKQWRKKRPKKKTLEETQSTRPTEVKVRIPISIKDLAVEMKVKASELISKLFMQGMVVTLNDLLEDETTVQLLGEEIGCQVIIDTSEEKRIQITDQTIQEEIAKTPTADLHMRAPVVTFMGHVDHGKTSLIDYIRKSNIASGEAGAITQHIGAFRCHTVVGELTVLDTPGHEAFSAMRARGADATDIVVLVVAGDEGIRQQTLEALKQAEEAKKTIVVAINKCDKPNFNAENVYRQLAENNLLPEVWGGQTITINCSAVTGEGIPQLLEMLALQAEVLELKASPKARARGTVLESEMHKGLGCKATVLVQNGTLRLGDALVFGEHSGRVKTMQNEQGKELKEAPPSCPVEITGLSGLPEAGQEFIVVANEKEAKDIAEVRMQGLKQKRQQMLKRAHLEKMMDQNQTQTKKTLYVVLRADVQGSLEALQTALEKIHSNKIDLNIVSSQVGEVTESDVQLAAPAGAVILGFHTQVESRSADLIKELGVTVRLHDIIYHAIDDIKEIMVQKLDKIEEESEKGKADVRAIFKSSHLGTIAGCLVTEGSIHRAHKARLLRDGKVLWKGSFSSIRRVNDDVREVQKGLECGIVLSNFVDVLEGDVIESYEVTYRVQGL